MPTTITQEIPAQTIDNGISVALIEPDNSFNVWSVRVEGRFGNAWCRVGSAFSTLAPNIVGQGGARVICTAMLDGVSQWRVVAETPANAQPGELYITAGPQPVTIPGGALVILEGSAGPPPSAGVEAENVAWVATSLNGGNDGTGQLGRQDRPFATINAAINACLVLTLNEVPAVVRVAGGFYQQEVFISAQARLNGLTLVADGQVTVDATSLPGIPLAVAAGSEVAATATQNLTISGELWQFVKLGGTAVQLAGPPGPNGYNHMGQFSTGGILFENCVIDGALVLQQLGLVRLHNVLQANPAANVVQNVSGLVLSGGTVLQDIALSVDPTQDLDTQLQPSPPLGLLVGAGCLVGDVTATGAPRFEVQSGGSMRGFSGLAWQEFFSAVPPTFSAAPSIKMFGKAEGDHDWAIPAESVGLVHTEVSYRGADYTGDMAGSKPATVLRVSVDAEGGTFLGALDFSGLLDMKLRGATYTEGALTSAGGATIDQSAFSVDTATANGVVPVAFTHPLPSLVGNDYTVAIEPQSAGFSLASVFISNKTPTGLDLNANAVEPVRLLIKRNP